VRVSLFGTGYVGLVTGACFAEAGHHVVCVDVDREKIERLRAGVLPIYEPGLEAIVRRTARAGRLRFTTDPDEAIAQAEFLFIAVGTPPDEDGSADIRHVLAVSETIGARLEKPAIVVVKSTVPVGTCDRVGETIARARAARGLHDPVPVLSNPEFLKEGAAVADFLRPDRIVVGGREPRALERMKALYAPFNRNHDRLLVMDVRSAELTKYAANGLLATKISFMNEIAALADRLDADVEQVRLGIGSDPRIGYQFIYPGAGYGGSCFPKDVRALARSAREHGLEPWILESVERRNEAQKHVLFEKIRAHFGERLAGRTFAVWGLAFKPNTDDLREASSRVLLEDLWRAGARVRAHDPEAIPAARALYGERPDLVFVGDPEDALSGADALVLVTEWAVYRSPDWALLAERLLARTVFDGRNLYDPVRATEAGLVYYGIGRGRRPEPSA
jgi:UDPglucose 6-dehydrogenase